MEKNFIRFFHIAVLIVFILSITPFRSAQAAPILSITPITWNVVGLDSNNVNVGPNNFPVGARVCNTGNTAATNLMASFVWDSANIYIALRSGSLSSITISSLAAGTVASPSCYDFYFEVSVVRNSLAYNTVRTYHISVSSNEFSTISTPAPREIFVEHLISQNRNATTDVKLNGTSIPAGGTMSLQVGNTYTIELDGSTATQGYNQLEDFINFPNTIFQVLSVHSAYSADSSGYVANTSDKLYADGCLWDNNPSSPTYRSCIGSDGKVGGTISTTYTVKIIGGVGTSQTLGTLIYDFSGSSYHYNSDFSTQARYASISSSLSMTKSFFPVSIAGGGTSTLSIAITNSSSSAVSGVSLTDTLPTSPAQMSIAVTPVATTSAGCVSPTFSPSAGATSITYTGGVAANNTCTLTVNVTAATNGTYANTTGHLLINGSDTGVTASANLMVETTPSSTCTSVIIAQWSITNTTPRPPLPTTMDTGVTTSNAIAFSNGVDQAAINTWWRITDPTASTSVALATDKYFRFQIPTSNYTNVKLSFSYTRGSTGPTSLDVYYGNSATISTTAPVNPVLLAGAQFTPTTGTLTTPNIDFTGKTNTTGPTYFFLYVYNGASNQGVNNWAGINNITFTGCRPMQTIEKVFSPNPIATGGTSTLTITLRNLDSTAATGAAFTDSLPAGLTVATTAATPQCSGTVTATADSSGISLSAGTIPANGSCTVVVSVKPSGVGVYPNTSGYLSANGSVHNSQASDILTVLAPPVISKSFSPNPIYAGVNSTLTFTITNPNMGTALSGVNFTDTFPVNLVRFAAPTTPQCGGAVSSTSGSITLTGGSLAAGGSCTVSVVTTASTTGSYVNTSGNVSTIISGVTYNGNTASDTLGVQAIHPGISILKQVSTSPSGPWAGIVNVVAGGNVYYRLTIENIGDVPLSPVSVTDPTLTISGCVWPSILPVGTSSVDPTATCVVGPVVAIAGSHSNTATAHGAYIGTVYDSTPKTATYVTTALTLIKSVAESSFTAAGNVLNYSYTITNTGAASLVGPVTVTDSNSNVICPNVNTVGNLDGNLDQNESIVCAAAYTVTAFDVSVGSVTNTANATVGTATSNKDRKTVYMNLPDLVVSKTNNTGGYAFTGTPFIWTLIVSNYGPQSATFTPGQTILSDQLPAGATYGSPTSGSFSGITNSGNISCSINASNLLTCSANLLSVTIGSTTGSFAVTIPVTPTAAGSLLNPLAKVDPNAIVAESNEGNNTSSDVLTATTLLAPTATKSFSANPILDGGTSTLTIAITNPAANAFALTGAAFTDAFPAGMKVATPLTFSTANCGSPTFTPAINDTTLTFSGGTIAVNGTCTVTVNVTAAPGGTYSNTVTVTTANSSASTPAIAKLAVYNLRPTKSIVTTSETSTTMVAGAERVAIGEMVRYRIAAQLPEGSFTNVQFTDNIPNGLQFVNDSTAKIAFVCNSGANCLTSSTISGAGLVISGNSTSVSPTFVVTGGAISGGAGSGASVTFSLGNLTNNDSDADNEYLVIEFNALVLNVNSAATINQGVDNSPASTGASNSNNRSNDVTFRVNGAQVGSNSANATVDIAEPAIVSIAKSVAPAAGVYHPGDSIIYTLVFTNIALGNNATTAFDISLADTLDSNLTVGTVTPSTAATTQGATCAGGTSFTSSSTTTAQLVTISISCLDPARSVTATIAATIKSGTSAGTINNNSSLTYTSLPGLQGGCATAPFTCTRVGTSGSGTGERSGSAGAGTDITILNNYYAASNTLPVSVTLRPDLTALKSNDALLSTVPVGGTFNWTVRVSNAAGTDTASFADAQTILIDDLPTSGATYPATGTVTKSAGTTGTINCAISSNTLTCTANGPVSIPAGESFDVQFLVTTISAGSLVNPSTIVGNTCQVDPNTVISESNETNNNCGPNTVTVSEATPTIDTQLKLASDNSNLSNPIPTGTALYDTAVLTGSYNAGGTIVYNIYSNNTCTTLVQNVTPAANTVVAGVIPNSANNTFNTIGSFWYQAVYSGDANNNGAASVCTSEPVVVVSINAVNDSGSTVDGAAGGQSFANVLVNDSLNEISPVLLANVNLTQVLTTNAGVTLNTADGSVNVAAGTAAGNYTVTYQICDKLNPTICDTATVTVPVRLTATPQADLSLTKTVNNSATKVGENVIFTITATNDGPSDATNVNVTDNLPAGLTFVSATPGTGTSFANPIWTIPSIAANSSATLQLETTVTQAGTIMNFTQITASDQFDPDSIPNNNQSQLPGEDDEASVVLGGIFDPPTATKTFNDAGFPQLEFRMVWINSSNSVSINTQVTDIIPIGTTYVPGSIACQPQGISSNAITVSSPLSAAAIPNSFCGFDAGNNRIQWQGTIGPDDGNLTEASAVNEIVISFRVTVDGNVNQVLNQGFSRTDVNNNANFDEEIILGASLVGTNQVVWDRSTSGRVDDPDVTLPKKLPVTGFAPGVITLLPEQSTLEMYTARDVWLEIPRMGVSLPIVGVPLVDGDWDVTWLGEQAGWLAGTAFPSWKGNSVLTGHVTLSDGKSGPFANLGDLKWGDRIIVHAYGSVYVYQVRENRIITPDNTSVLKHEKDSWLTLITCKNYNEAKDIYTSRVSVRAVLVSVESEQVNPSRQRVR